MPTTPPPQGGGSKRFVDDLSNWYVRRSRRRFWNPGGEGGSDAIVAFHTLHECLVTVAALLAPFTPFVADELWGNLAAGRGGRPDSVHLAAYPAVHEAALDPGLDEAMASARQLVELGRRVRVETKTRTRQPLADAVVHLAGRHGELDDLLDVVAEELNVKEVRFAESAEAFGRWRAKPNFKVLGPRLGARVQAVGAALAADDGAVAARLASGEAVDMAVGDDPAVTIGPGDVELSQEVLEGWGVASEGGVTVALDLEITPELRREGLAREFVRIVQDARKAAGFDVSDRIALGVETAGELAAALEAHRASVAGETLARDVLDAPVDDAALRQEADIDGEPVTVSVRRV